MTSFTAVGTSRNRVQKGVAAVPQSVSQPTWVTRSVNTASGLREVVVRPVYWKGLRPEGQPNGDPEGGTNRSPTSRVDPIFKNKDATGSAQKKSRHPEGSRLNQEDLGSLVKKAQTRASEADAHPGWDLLAQARAKKSPRFPDSFLTGRPAANLKRPTTEQRWVAVPARSVRRPSHIISSLA